jgi:hypothetical protein
MIRAKLLQPPALRAGPPSGRHFNLGFTHLANSLQSLIFDLLTQVSYRSRVRCVILPSPFTCDSSQVSRQRFAMTES